MGRTYHFMVVVYRMKVAGIYGKGNELHRLESMAAALVEVLFFVAIIGMFGLRVAIAGLAVFVFAAVVVCVALATEGRES